jgi:hypothetical protein
MLGSAPCWAQVQLRTRRAMELRKAKELRQVTKKSRHAVFRICGGAGEVLLRSGASLLRVPSGLMSAAAAAAGPGAAAAACTEGMCGR